jgi:hypothetical protein
MPHEGMAMTTLTTAQFEVLAALGKAGGSLVATKTGFPPGVNGNAMSSLRRMRLVSDAMVAGRGHVWSMTPAGRVAWVREHAPRVRAARHNETKGHDGECGCSKCNPYDRSP